LPSRFSKQWCPATGCARKSWRASRPRRSGSGPARPSAAASHRYRVGDGMQFEANDSQRKLVAMVRDFCVREVKPHAFEWDREERFPRDTVAHLGDLGLLGMAVPEELGGSQLDTVSIAMVIEEIARW